MLVGLLAAWGGSPGGLPSPSLSEERGPGPPGEAKVSRGASSKPDRVGDLSL